MNMTPVFKQINSHHPQLKEVIAASIGRPTANKIDAVLASYKHEDKLVGAFISDQLVGCVGYCNNAGHLVIRHLSVTKNFQHQKIATTLVRYILAFEDCYKASAFTDMHAKGFYEKLFFQCTKSGIKFGTERFECVYSKKEAGAKSALNILGVLSSKINERYGYVTHVGENFGEPVMNSGPCGVFANIFYKAWNARFVNKVKIAFIMQNEPKECYHVAIILPNNFLYDGGIGVHLEKIYLDKGLDVVVMDEYDEQLLDERSYGLGRDYPKYCPDFSMQELSEIIHNALNGLYSSIM